MTCQYVTAELPRGLCISKLVVVVIPPDIGPGYDVSPDTIDIDLDKLTAEIVILVTPDTELESLPLCIDFIELLKLDNDPIF